jgi:hypothetical protein
VYIYKFKIGEFSFKIRNFPPSYFQTFKLKKALKNEAREIVRVCNEFEINREEPFSFKDKKALFGFRKGIY